LVEGSPPNAKIAVRMATKNEANSFAAFDLRTWILPRAPSGRLDSYPRRMHDPVALESKRRAIELRLVYLPYAV
jgi:hypothetical protein